MNKSLRYLVSALVIILIVQINSSAQFIDDFNDNEFEGWSFYSGDGIAQMDFISNDGSAKITVDASRDTDEIAMQRVSLYLRKKGREIRPGRNELESVNRPIVIGGVLVCPGDVVVADGDGVVVVPRRVAKEVAEYAHEILRKDKNPRTELYKELKMKPDQSVN